jgi:hypothetical protein
MARRPESTSLPTRQAGCWTRPGLLVWGGAPAGIEPATPSLPWNHQEPLCGRSFSQVVPDRQGRSYWFSFGQVMRSLKLHPGRVVQATPRKQRRPATDTRARWRTNCGASCQQARATTLSRLQPAGLPRIRALGDVEADEGQLHPGAGRGSGDGPDDAEQAERQESTTVHPARSKGSIQCLALTGPTSPAAAVAADHLVEQRPVGR